MMVDSRKVGLSPDILGALQDILAHARVVIPDLETPFSRFPNPYHSLRDESVNAILTQHQQQLDAFLLDVSGLETVIERAKNLHRQTVEGRDKIIQSMMLHRRHASTLWRLPFEVLSQIFVYCLPKNHYPCPTSSDSNSGAPMLLIRICRHWRKVALNTPNLWCTLSVGLNKRHSKEAVSAWLKWSGGHPLSLAFEYLLNHDPTNLQSLIQPYYTRISSLRIKYEGAATTPELLLQNLPALQELTLWLHGTHDDKMAIAKSISRLPLTLRSFTFLGPVFGSVELELFSSYKVLAQLTNVRISLHQPYGFLHLLCLCPNLASFRVSLHSAYGAIRPLEPLTHINLRFLTIGGPGSALPIGSALPLLFNVLTLPNLRVLEVCLVRDWPHEEFKAFLARSKCPLECLRFGFGARSTDDERAEYIVLIPSLEVVVDRWFTVGS